MDENSNIQDAEGIEFKSSPEAVAFADAVLADIKNRSFSSRHPELGKMINCQVCDLRHRASQKCEQKFKEMWLDEDLETGELSIQYAIVPLPGQKGTPKSVIGAAHFAKKRRNPHPSRRKLQFIRLVRRLTPDEYTEEDLQGARDKAVKLLGLDKSFKDKLPKRKDWKLKKEVENVI